MRSLPLFHRIAGQPVIVLGDGDAAEPKQRLVERAGGRVVASMQEGIDEGARLAFIAHDDAARCEGDAIRARCAGLLVNVVDRPELCDFTTPSLLERDPVLIAVGTSGASAGLAKQLRLRLEAALPSDLGLLASGIAKARDAIKARFPMMSERRGALDRALGEGGPLDVLAEGSSGRIEEWLAGAAAPQARAVYDFTLLSDDPEELTMRQARLLGTADAIVADAAIPPEILARARADAARLVLGDDAGPDEGVPDEGVVVILRRQKA